jgi:hypothetical protein
VKEAVASGQTVPAAAAQKVVAEASNASSAPLVAAEDSVDAVVDTVVDDIDSEREEEIAAIVDTPIEDIPLFTKLPEKPDEKPGGNGTAPA